MSLTGVIILTILVDMAVLLWIFIRLIKEMRESMTGTFIEQVKFGLLAFTKV